MKDTDRSTPRRDGLCRLFPDCKKKATHGRGLYCSDEHRVVAARAKDAARQSRHRVTPYFERGGIRIYHADYRDVEVEVSRDQHVLVTDPPYGLGDKWDGGTWADDPMYAEAKKWDVKVPASTSGP